MIKYTDTVQSVERTLKIIEALSEEYELGITDLSKRVGMGKSTVHRLISTLHATGYVLQTAEGKYMLSLKLFDIGNRVINHRSIRHEEKPFLERLAELTHETVNLAILENDCLVYIDRIESMEPLRIGLEIGQGYSAHCTALGKIWLAFISPHELEGFLSRHTEWQRYTEHTIVDKDMLRKEVKQVRINGFAVEKEEYRAGVHCVAAPVFDHHNRIAAAVSVSGPSIRMLEDVMAERIQQVVTITAQISARIGYKL